jgi:serine-type D-Ala-D-Ala carboxypeptidase/endopeptidase (penicillin-binding protein 4)
MPSKNRFAQTRRGPFATWLLLVALLACAAPAATPRAQEQRRDRRVNAPAPTPTPRPSATPRPTPQSSTTPRPQATPARPTPTPAPTLAPQDEQVAPTPTPAARLAPAPRTPDELAERIRGIIARPEFAASQLAVKVSSLDTGRVLFEENAQKWMQPASNLKLFTVAAALDRFGPDHRFVTSVYAGARPDAAGNVRGDLIVYGRGDPTFATRFNPEGDNDYFRAMDELAARVAASGVRRVEGDMVGDESYFAGLPLALGWEWDDLQWWYGAEVSALTVNDNSVDLSVKPGARVGAPCQISLGPATTLVTVVDRTTTSPRGSRRELSVHRPLGQNVLEISGSLPLDDRGYTASVAVTNPALFFATMLRQSLERRGVVFTGRTRTVNWRDRERAPLDVSALTEVGARQSPPLSVIAAQTLKPSQNLYTELLLRALGKAAGSDPKQTSEQAGIAAVKNFLRAAGVEERQLNMLDGSGLSRGNLVTADATVRLLVHMNRHPHGAAFRAALPVAAVDGTLRNRMRGTAAASNVRAKTGTLSSSTSLSGYLFTAAGERLAFSLMINNPPRDTDPRTGFTDPVAVLLASFTGRS